jgi:hypothetical protein
MLPGRRRRRRRRRRREFHRHPAGPRGLGVADGVQRRRALGGGAGGEEDAEEGGQRAGSGMGRGMVQHEAGRVGQRERERECVCVELTSTKARNGREKSMRRVGFLFSLKRRVLFCFT